MISQRPTRARILEPFNHLTCLNPDGMLGIKVFFHPLDLVIFYEHQKMIVVIILTTAFVGTVRFCSEGHPIFFGRDIMQGKTKALEGPG